MTITQYDEQTNEQAAQLMLADGFKVAFVEAAMRGKLMELRLLWLTYIDRALIAQAFPEAEILPFEQPAPIDAVAKTN